MKLKFFKCEKCGNIVLMVEDKGVPLFCCNQKMTEIIAGTTDGAVEKHVPTFEVKENVISVNVGSTSHPMEEKHYIEWVAVQTKKGSQLNKLSPNNKPETSFILCEDDEAQVIYAYCNLHGLWKAEL